MCRTHFEDESFDYILSGDVMEHIPDPEKAFEESFRILRPGGCHIFTAPFYQHRFTNEKRALIDQDGYVQFLYRPWYHLDPIHAEGALVYNIFAPEVMCQLEAIGFEARLCIIRSPFHGMLGRNGIVMIAEKVLEPNHKRDAIFPDEVDWPAPGS
jgi:SAM-dependent methyltransferase